MQKKRKRVDIKRECLELEFKKFRDTWGECKDDRLLFCNIYDELMKSLDAMGQVDNTLCWVAYNQMFEEEYERLRSIAMRFTMGEKIVSLLHDGLDFSVIDKSKGEIYRTEPVAYTANDDRITLGCRYSADDWGGMYIYNVFVGAEYISIPGCGTKTDKLPMHIVNDIVAAVRKYSS